MNKTLNKILTLLFAAVFFFASFLTMPQTANALSSNGYTYTVNSDGKTATITGYTGSGGNITIPSTLGGKTVTALGEFSFAYNYNITGVTIPGSIKTIGYSVFCNNESITAVTFQNGVKTIEASAFIGCWGLKSVVLPASTTTVEIFAFGDCVNLTSITVNSANTAYTSVNGVLFSKDAKKLVCYPGGITASSYTVPSKVTEICDGAFYCCRFHLKSVSLPSGLLKIGECAFEGCENLDSVTIPASVTLIEERAFSNAKAINVSGGSASFSSADGILYNKDKTTLLECPGEKAGNVSVPSGVKRLEDYAFFSCNNITGITLPEGLQTIGDNCIVGCKITSLTIPDSVTEIGCGGISGCTNLKQIKLPSSITHLAGSMLCRLNSLETLTIPASVSVLDTAVIEDCPKLKSVYFYGNVPTTYDDPFYDCPLVKVYYLSGATGWTNPWHGHTTAAFQNPLSNITLSAASLSPSFSALCDHYTVSLPEDTASVAITPVKSDSAAVFTIDGQNVSSKTVTLDLSRKQTVSITASLSGISKTYTVAVKRWPYCEADAAYPKSDGFSFANKASSFGYGSSYKIPAERYKEVFGWQYVFLFQYILKNWNGSCTGMSLASLGMDSGILHPQTYQSGKASANALSAPGSASALLTQSLERLQISAWTQTFELAQNFNTKNKSVQELYNRLKDMQDKPCLICFDFPTAAHTVVPYKMEDITFGNGHAGAMVHLYDCRYPYSASGSYNEAHILLDLTANTWSYADTITLPDGRVLHPGTAEGDTLSVLLFDDVKSIVSGEANRINDVAAAREKYFFEPYTDSEMNNYAFAVVQPQGDATITDSEGHTLSLQDGVVTGGDITDYSILPVPSDSYGSQPLIVRVKTRALAVNAESGGVAGNGYFFTASAADSFSFCANTETGKSTIDRTTGGALQGTATYLSDSGERNLVLSGQQAQAGQTAIDLSSSQFRVQTAGGFEGQVQLHSSDVSAQSLNVNAEIQPGEGLNLDLGLSNNNAQILSAFKDSDGDGTGDVALQPVKSGSGIQLAGENTAPAITGISTLAENIAPATPKSSDADIKTVSLKKNGVAVASWVLGTPVKTAGEYDLTVTDVYGLSSSLHFKVVAPVKVSCKKTDAAYYGSASGSITATASGGGSGTYLYSVNGGKSWQSSNRFKVAAGKVTVTACDAKNKSNLASASVAISQPKLAGTYQAAKIPAKVLAGTAIVIKPPAAPKNYTLKSVAFASGNTSIAFADAKGNVTFLKGGKVKLTVTALFQPAGGTGKAITKTIKKSVTVRQFVAAIKLSKTSATLKIKKTLKLTAAISPSSATSKKIKWKSSNTRIATVSSSGVVTGKAKGTATIYCAAQDGSNVTAKCKITVY
jgi:uncharacterized protein YjdB